MVLPAQSALSSRVINVFGNMKYLREYTVVAGTGILAIGEFFS